MLSIAPSLLACILLTQASTDLQITPSLIELRLTGAAPFTPAQASAFVGRTIPFSALGASPKSPPLGKLSIVGARLEGNNRTLVLGTDPHPFQASYRLEFPEAFPHAPLDYTLAGAEASWAEGDGLGDVAWTTSLPTFGIAALDSTPAETLSKPGQLTLRSRVVVPAGQPLTFQIRSNAPFEAILGEFSERVEAAENGTYAVSIPFNSQGEYAELWVILETGRDGRPPTLTVTPKSNAKATDASVLLLPWASLAPSGTSGQAPPSPPFDLAGGDPTRGAEVFRSQEARCAQCHKAGGEGGEIGPDLVSQSGRDPALIYQELADPSAVIAPEYITYTVARDDGRVAVGVLRTKGPDTLRILDTDAKETVIPRSEVADIQASDASVMPVGLAGALGEQRVRDLIAYLRSLPPSAPRP